MKAIPGIMESKTETVLEQRLEVFLTYFFFFQVFIGCLWAFQNSVLPLQDYPNHLANSFVLFKFKSSEFFRYYFTTDYFPYPYLLQNLIVELLIPFGINFTSNAFAAIAIAAAPCGVFFLFRSLMPDKMHLAYFSLPLIYNKLFFKGTLNFILGISLSYVCLALFWKLLHKGWNRKGAILLGILLMLTFFTHLIAFLLLSFSVLILVSWYGYESRDKKTIRALLLFLPAAVIFLINIAQSPSFYFGQNLGSGHVLAAENIKGKLAETGLILACFSQEENRIMLPVWIALFSLVLIGLRQVRQYIFPFLLCGALFLLYFLAPRGIGPLIRPEERVFFFTLFLLPLCAVNRRYLFLEKIVVILFCTVFFVKSADYFSTVCDRLTPSMNEARKLLKELPPHKKLMPIWAQTPFVGQIGYMANIQAYYVMDREGYVPSLFHDNYIIVKYKKAPIFSPYPEDITFDMLRQYDFLFLWGREANVEAYVALSGFAIRKQTADMSIYEKVVQ